jgi:hypothetical protein
MEWRSWNHERSAPGWSDILWAIDVTLSVATVALIGVGIAQFLRSAARTLGTSRSWYTRTTDPNRTR